MPFTVSHAAAIIPFNRRPFVLSGLVAGSVSPDFLYFIPGVSNRHITHTLPGLVIFCLPASLIALYLYHAWLKQPAVSLLPRALQYRVPNSAYRFNPSWFWLIVSILIGAFTPIFWDNFTHSYGLAVKLLPVLAQPTLSFLGEPLFVYKLLQYFSTVVGGLVVVNWIAQYYLRTELHKPPTAHQSNFSVLLSIAALSCLCGLIYGWRLYPIGGLKVFVVQTVIVSMSTLCGLLSLYSLGWHLRLIRR